MTMAEPMPKRRRSTNEELNSALARKGVVIRPTFAGGENFECTHCFCSFTRKSYAAVHPCTAAGISDAASGAHMPSDTARCSVPAPTDPSEESWPWVPATVQPEDLLPSGVDKMDVDVHAHTQAWIALSSPDTQIYQQEAEIVAQATAAAVDAEYEVCAYADECFLGLAMSFLWRHLYLISSLCCRLSFTVPSSLCACGVGKTLMTKRMRCPQLLPLHVIRLLDIASCSAQCIRNHWFGTCCCLSINMYMPMTAMVQVVTVSRFSATKCMALLYVVCV